MKQDKRYRELRKDGKVDGKAIMNLDRRRLYGQKMLMMCNSCYCNINNKNNNNVNDSNNNTTATTNNNDKTRDHEPGPPPINIMLCYLVHLV